MRRIYSDPRYYYTAPESHFNQNPTSFPQCPPNNDQIRYIAYEPPPPPPFYQQQRIRYIEPRTQPSFDPNPSHNTRFFDDSMRVSNHQTQQSKNAKLEKEVSDLREIVKNLKQNARALQSNINTNNSQSYTGNTQSHSNSTESVTIPSYDDSEPDIFTENINDKLSETVGGIRVDKVLHWILFSKTQTCAKSKVGQFFNLSKSDTKKILNILRNNGYLKISEEGKYLINAKYKTKKLDYLGDDYLFNLRSKYNRKRPLKDPNQNRSKSPKPAQKRRKTSGNDWQSVTNSTQSYNGSIQSEAELQISQSDQEEMDRVNGNMHSNIDANTASNNGLPTSASMERDVHELNGILQDNGGEHGGGDQSQNVKADPPKPPPPPPRDCIHGYQRHNNDNGYSSEDSHQSQRSVSVSSSVNGRDLNGQGQFNGRQTESESETESENSDEEPT